LKRNFRITRRGSTIVSKASKRIQPITAALITAQTMDMV
jgi:hypothetical protein